MLRCFLWRRIHDAGSDENHFAVGGSFRSVRIDGQRANTYSTGPPDGGSTYLVNGAPNLQLSPDPDYQPVEFFDEQGVYRGISADYIALLEQRLGFRFQVIDRTKVAAAWNAGQVRVAAMPTCAATPEREKTWLFTTSYMEFPTYLITRKNVSNSLTLDQLNGSRVAVVEGYAVREYLATNYPNLILDPVPDARTGLEKVSFGLVDVFVSEWPVATYSKPTATGSCGASSSTGGR